LHWLAVTTNHEVEVVQHNYTSQYWRSGPIALGLINALPVPRFPDRRHAVYLATGQGATRPELVGVRVSQGESNPPAPWRVALARVPFLSAVSFTMEGALVILLASQEGSSTVLSQLTVDEEGRVIWPDTAIRTSDARVLAMAVDMRPGAAPKFLVLEEDAREHGRISLVHIPLMGRIDAMPPTPLPGWPMRAEGEKSIPLAAREIALEVATDGAPWVVFTDERDNLHAGSLVDFRVKQIRAGEGPNGEKRLAIHPHVGALANSVTVSCFTETGELFHFVAQQSHRH
jgi:hypothetical protein